MCLGAALYANPVIKMPVLAAKLFVPHPDEIYKKNEWSVRVWSQINGEPVTPLNKTVEFDDKVTLFAVVTCRGKKYSDSKWLIEKGIARPMADLPESVSFKWYKLESEYYMYCSRKGYLQEFGKSRFKPVTDFVFKILALDKIRYKQTCFAGNAPVAPIDQKSDTNVPIKWKGRYVGTMRYKVELTVDGGTVSSFGKGCLDSDRFKLKEKVHRISVKAGSGNGVLDMGFAHGNLPYYYGSNSFSWGWYGSDCAKFVSVVHRKTDSPKIGYLSTYALVKRRAKAVITGVDKNGCFLHNKRRIRYGHDVSVGDIIVVSPVPFHHAGLIGEDKNQNGWLDKYDYVLHTGGKAPVYEPLCQTVLSTPNKNLKIVMASP